MPHFRRTSILSLTVFALISPMASAQTSPTVAAKAVDPAIVELEKVEVTGEKIARDLQDTPTSVAAVANTQIETLGVRDLRDAFRLMANVNANQSNTGFSIRGLNSEGIGSPGSNLRPLASLTIDGAAQSFEGIRRGARGAWDIQQIEVLRGPQSTLQGRNALAGAVIVKTNDPTDQLELSGRVLGGSQSLFAPAAMVNVPLADGQVGFRFAAESARRELGIGYSDPVGDELDDETFDSFRGKVLLKPNAAPGLSLLLSVSDVTDKPAVNAVDPANPFSRRLTVSATTAEMRETSVTATTLETRYAPPRAAWAVVSTTAWIGTDAIIYTPSPAYDRDEIREDRDFTQELRFEYVSPSETRRSVVAGFFYGELDAHRDSVIAVGPPVTPIDLVVQDLLTDTLNENLAVYAEARTPLGEKVNLTLGARYDTEEAATDNLDRLTAARTITDTDFDAFLPRGSIAYDFTPDQSLAFTVARGYRAGFVENTRTIDPEYLTSFELAWRSTWFGRRLRLNANVFHYDWTDQQITIANPNPLLPSITANAGQSRSFGGELDLSARVTRDLTVGVSLGALDTELVEFGADSGNEFPEAPDFNGAAWAMLRLPRGFYVAGDFRYTGSFYGVANVANTPAGVVPGHGVANASVGYETTRAKLSVGVRNLFDRDYLTGRGTTGSAYVGDELTYVVSATLRY